MNAEEKAALVAQLKAQLLQLPLETEYGTRVRTSDPVTSHEAAASLDVTVVQQRVLDLHLAHAARGLTDEELLGLYASRFVTPESSPRKRRCDLTRMNVLADSGERRVLKSGRSGIVWKLKMGRFAVGGETTQGSESR